MLLPNEKLSDYISIWSKFINTELLFTRCSSIVSAHPERSTNDSQTLRIVIKNERRRYIIIKIYSTGIPVVVVVAAVVVVGAAVVVVVGAAVVVVGAAATVTTTL